ncbi:hypothetical protein [Mesorhizobium sp. M0998]|uniref:hypothetical protein n=1 Tax=Mesorhizobium sp. M0998 TaxID=2957044 RepID=UPI00333A0444
MLVRGQKLLTEVLTELRRLLPFQLLGFDTDNDSVFLNETIRDYWLDAGIEFTRCRPYRKNDQVVRRTEERRRGAARCRVSPAGGA